MAIPKEFDEVNQIWKGWEADESKGLDKVNDLPVHRTETESISMWQLSDEELKEINKTKTVWLSIVGEIHPPVFITGCKTDLFRKD